MMIVCVSTIYVIWCLYLQQFVIWIVTIMEMLRLTVWRVPVTRIGEDPHVVVGIYV